MIHQIDRWWFRMLGQMHVWLILQAMDHCDRMKQGRAGRLSAWRFQVLGTLHPWTIRQGVAHCRREKERRFRQLMKAQNPHLN